MRALLAALLATNALPALADTIPATSKITAVTVYPDGAKITREVRFDAPSGGTHELLVTDMPASTEAGLMRLDGSEGLSFGAFSLRSDRLPPREEPLTAEQTAAKDALDAAEAAERDAQAAVAAVEARIHAAEARANFVTSLSGSVPENATAESLRAMAEMVGAETLTAAEAAALARRDLYPAQKALEDAAEARSKAEAAYNALPGRDMDYTALSVAIEAPAAGQNTLTVTHYIQGASWRPFYDIYLTRQGSPALTIDRSVLVTQYTGEDWTGVDLVLSSSRPAEQAAPSMIWPDLRQITPPYSPDMMARADAPAMAESAMVGAAPPAPAPISAVAGIEGDTVVYAYPRKVDVASGVEDLRLSLDRIEASPEVMAVAVPRFDRTAFVEASFTNGSGEPLLPGEALLFREGVLVGAAQLPMIAAGEETELAFGAIDSLRIRRDMPVNDQGQRGVFSTSNERVERATLVIENFGTESWPLRVIDQMSYSEQQDLKITLQADPAPDVTDLDGQRGVLAWEFDLPAGQKKEIKVGQTLSWPDGMDLR